ncbi:hypothetical protein BHE74_00053886 [Ensete ventricosum]|nr:hypothetical protein BHE74_00053886 [Ensete ventricosum]
MQATALPYGRHYCPREAPRGRAVLPCAGAAPVVGSPGREAAPCGLAVGNNPLRPDRGRCLRPQAPPLQAPAMPACSHACWRLPLQGALAVAGRPLVRGLGRN